MRAVAPCIVRDGVAVPPPPQRDDDRGDAAGALQPVRLRAALRRTRRAGRCPVRSRPQVPRTPMHAPPSPGRPQRTAIVVAGMHRSGTSALTRTIGLLGADLPADPIPGKEGDNRLGYWESSAVVAVNREAHASAGSSWKDWTPMPQGWWESPVKDGFLDRAVAALEEAFAGSPFFVLKEPRICRLLPLWIEALERVGARQVVVMPVRHPLEVAASLDRRNELPRGEAALSWLRHVLDAEGASRPVPRVITHYQDLLDDWRRTADRIAGHLDLAWPRRNGASESEIDAFLMPAERNHHAEHAPLTGPDPRLDPWVREVYDILERWSRDAGRDTDMGRLDAVRGALDGATRTFEPIVSAANDLSKECRRLQRVMENMEARRTELRGQMRETRIEARRAAAARDRAAETIERLREQLAHAKSALAERRAEAQERKTLLAQERAELKLLKRNAADTQKALTETQSALEAAQRRASGNAEQRDAALGVQRETARELKARTKDLARTSARLSQTRAARDAAKGAAVDLMREAMARLLARGRRPRLPLLSRLPFWRRRVLRRQSALLRASPLFDPDWYLERNKDVKSTGMDPALHYVTCGFREGRAPSAPFD